MQEEHQDAEDVFPEEGARKEVAAEHDALPDRAGDHDRVEQQRLDDDRAGCSPKSLACCEITQDENQTHREG